MIDQAESTSTTNSPILLLDQALISALKAHYPDHNVYGELLQQDFQPPCLVVQLLTTGQIPQLGKRYCRSYSYTIQAYPASGSTAINAQLRAIGEGLFDVLEFVPLDNGLVRGDQMRYELLDGVLHFFVNYRLFGYKAQETAPMMATIALEQ